MPFYHQFKQFQIVFPSASFMFHISEEERSTQANTPQNGYHMIDNDINMLLQHLNYCTQTDTELSLPK